MKKNTVTTSCAAYAAALFFLCLTASDAQNPPNPSPAPGAASPTPGASGQSAPPAAPAPPTPAAPTPAPPAPRTIPLAVAPHPGTAATSYPHRYLTQKVALTAQDKVFYVTRQDLGCSIAGGMSDKTISTAIKFTVDDEILQKEISSLAPRVNSPVRPARPFLVSPIVHETAVKSDNVPRPATIAPAEPKAILDVAASVAAVDNTLTTSPLTMSMPLTLKTGAVPAKTVNLSDINARLSHFVTHFDTGEVGRTVTVRKAISLIDGTVVQPGQIFSINGTVGERTIARGFGVGKVFINGTMEDQVGGGMCQVATTLFNAALLANLKTVERHQHVRTVPYVPAGGDATVYYGEKDFKFQNNTHTPIYIYYKTYGRFAVCDLYGKAEPNVKVHVVTIPTRLGPRYYKGVIQRFVTVGGKTTNDYTAYSSYKWTPALDYLR